MTKDELQGKLKILIKQVYSNKVINLKNEQIFYLIYGKRSWICQVRGKKYYLLNLPEEERAVQAIANILRFGTKEDSPEGGGEGAADAASDLLGGEDTTEETPEEETT